MNLGIIQKISNNNNYIINLIRKQTEGTES